MDIKGLNASYEALKYLMTHTILSLILKKKALQEMIVTVQELLKKKLG